jgi:chitinase
MTEPNTPGDDPVSRRVLYWSAAALLSGVLLVSLPFAIGALSEDSPAPSNPPNSTESGPARVYEKIGYFPRWASYQRDFHVKNLVDSGAIANLTTIQYAFAELDSKGRCFLKPKGRSGSAYDDYVRSYKAGRSVDGIADGARDPLRGHFGQLQRLKQKYPNLRVNLAIDRKSVV